MRATHIAFVDSYVRRRHAVSIAVMVAFMLVVVLHAFLGSPPKGATAWQYRLFSIGLSTLLIAVFQIREHLKRPKYGLYIQPGVLMLKFHETHMLALQPNANGEPLVIIRVVGKKYELTTASQKSALYVPVAAIPSLPQILLHYDLDVKLVEPT